MLVYVERSIDVWIVNFRMHQVLRLMLTVSVDFKYGERNKELFCVSVVNPIASLLSDLSFISISCWTPYYIFSLSIGDDDSFRLVGKGASTNAEVCGAYDGNAYFSVQRTT